MRQSPCPRCNVPLQLTRKDNVLDYECVQCDGRAATLAALKRRVPGAGVNILWAAVNDASAQSELVCPSCSKRMSQVKLTAADLANVVDGTGRRPTGVLELDVCRPCSLVWFDAGERTSLGAEPSSVAIARPGYQASKPEQISATQPLPNMNTGSVQTAAKPPQLPNMNTGTVQSARKPGSEPEPEAWSWAGVKKLFGIG